MTRKIALIVAIISLGSVSCREQFEVVDDVNFDVTTKAVTFKVGEPVRFTFSGNTDFITFYSGEKGHDYAFKNKDRITEGSMVFSFLTNTGAGTSGFPNPSVVPISYSTDFSGEYTEEAVRAATWIDITDQFTLPQDTPIQNVSSGDVPISSYFPNDETPLWFSFYYKVAKYDATAANGKGNGRTKWIFISPSFKGVVEGISEEIYDITTSNWQIITTSSYDTEKPADHPNVDLRGKKITMLATYRPSGDREAWAICGPIYRQDIKVNEGPDLGVGIKAMADAMLSSYEYTYNTPGEYTVTFVGRNANVYAHKESVKSIKIRIQE